METGLITTKQLFSRDDVKAKFQELLGKRAPAFITSVLQTISQNNLLAKAEPTSIYHSAAVAATLDLPINNSLGFAYIVPYNQKQPDGSYKQVAQFQIGYKGFIQLAQRTGQFKGIGACKVYEGQLIEDNPLTGPVFNWSKKDSETVIGYAAYFSLVNGFSKSTYTKVDDLKKHGLKFSQSYKNPKTKSNSLWETDFDSMAIKTVLKLLLARYAPLSIDMQKAVVTDQGVINDTDANDVTYVDNEEVTIDKESERIRLMIEQAATIEELKAMEPHLKDEHLDAYTVKKDQLTSKA